MQFVSERITIDDKICNGKPTIRGKRITVQTVLEFLSAGESVEEVLNQYPSLEREDIAACLEFEIRTKLVSKAQKTIFADYIDKTEKDGIKQIIRLSFGVFFGILGVYLELRGIDAKHEFFAYILWQAPVYLLAMMFEISKSLFFLITFFWWFIFGVLLASLLVYIKNYINSIYENLR